MAIAITRPDDAPAERQPGQFARHPTTGAPYVLDVWTLVDVGYKKAELVAIAADHGIGIDISMTVPQLKAILGDLAKRGRKAQFGRPSSLGKQIENTTNLQKWSERAVALGLFLDDDDPIFAALDDLDPSQWNLDDPDARDVLDAVAVNAKARAQAGVAAERGTHTHELTEDHDNEVDWIERARRGEDLGIPVETAEALVAAWAKMLAEFDIEILATEATCVDDVWRQAGTLDRICRLRRDTRFITATGEIVTLPAGWVGILDIKTGKLRLGPDGFVDHWHGYAVQLASYAQSVRYDPDTDERTPWEWEIDQQWAIIAHLDVLAALDGEAKCRLVLVDLEAGRHAGALCVAAREWERRRDVFSIPTDDLTVSVPVAATPHGHTAGLQPVGEGESGPSPAVIAAVDSALPQQAPEVPPSSGAVAAAAESQGCDSAAVPHADRDGPSTRPDRPVAGDAATFPPASPATTPDPARRAALLERYAALTRDDKLRFIDLGVDRDDLDAIEAALDAIVGSTHVGTKSVRRIVITRAMIEAAEAARPEWDGPRFDGDEGPIVADAVRDEMRKAIAALPPAATELLNGFAAEAHRTVGSFSMKSPATRRRWEIARALVNLARAFWDDTHDEWRWDDELVRGALVTVTGDEAIRQPGIGLGIVVGMLELDQAIAFADLAASIERGGAVPDASTGRWLWRAA